MENRHGNVSNEPRAGRAGRVFLDTIAEAILNLAFFVFRFFGWSLRWTLATAFFLLVMAGAGLYVFNSAVTGGEYVTVPNITQLSVTQASFELGKVGLEMGKQTPMFSDQVPPYHVISQRPEPGAVVRAGREVFPTVSQGAEIASAPEYVGKALKDVEGALTPGMRLGNKAWIRHSAPRDQVIAQDPPAGRPLRAGEPVHLLLSKGTTQNVLTMPSIVGLSVEDAMALLAPMGVQVLANRIDNPNAEPNRVLAQTPAPGTLLQEGQSVTYEVRTSGETVLPNSMRKVEVVYTVPGEWTPREVRIDVIDRRGTRQTVLPSQEQYNAGERPKYEPNTRLRLPLSFNEELTVEVYVDGQRACTYYYEGDNPPVITNHLDPKGQEEGVAQT